MIEERRNMPLRRVTDVELRVIVAEIKQGHEELRADFDQKHKENATEIEGIRAEQKAMRNDITGLQAITGSVNELRTLMTDHAATDLRELGLLRDGQQVLTSKLDKNTAVTEKVDNFLRFGRGTVTLTSWVLHQLKVWAPALGQAIFLWLLFEYFMGRAPLPPLH